NAEEALERAGGSPPIVIDARKLLDEGDTSQNYVLQPGDVIYVPKAKRVFVLGEVRRPGAVAFTEGLTLLQAISLAGGTTEMASNSIEVTRKVNGEEQRFKLKYKKILRDSNLDLKLKPNDVIVVKRRLF
ncbi:MAG: SLBB domain-containing protein, partial [Alphaproteobacteria bacterium]